MRRSTDPQFCPDDLPEPKEETIAWIDIMGTAPITQWSGKVSSVNIAKLDKAVIQQTEPYNVNIYPMMDGIYLTHPSGEVISQIVANIFNRFAAITISRYREAERLGSVGSSDLKFAPILRAGVARGDVYHGTDIEKEPFSDHELSTEILMGEPVAQAHLEERESPPFSYKLHSSVEHEQAGEVIDWWRSSNKRKEETVLQIRDALLAYFNYYLEHHSEHFDDAEIESHINDVEDYYPETTLEVA
jgi:hypothetical protein